MRIQILIAATFLSVTFSSGHAEERQGSQVALERVERLVRDPHYIKEYCSDIAFGCDHEVKAKTPEARELFRRVRHEQTYFWAQMHFKQLFSGGLTQEDKKTFFKLIEARQNKAYRDNLIWLKSVLGKIGWFRISVYGKSASNAAWVMVQHADEDLAFQISVLETLRPLAKQNEVNPQDVAYLEDRVAKAEGRPQIYGTQSGAGSCENGKPWRPHPIKDEARVDELRKAIGLEPLTAYARDLTKMCKGR